MLTYGTIGWLTYKMLMNWIYIGLLSHFFWALVNISDKFLVKNKIKSPLVYFLLFSWIGTFPVLIVPFIDFYVPPVKEFLMLILSSAFWFFGGIPYIFAIQKEDVTRINIWWSFIPLWSLVLGFLLFGEQLSQLEMVAFILLALGAAVASIHARKGILVFSKAVLLMLVAGFSFALYAVLLHEITKTVPMIVAFAWSHILGFLMTFFLFFSKKFRSDFFHEKKNLTPVLLVALFGVTVLDNLGVFFNQLAISLTPASLVFSLEGSQVVFAFFITLLIGLYNKNLLKEELDRRNMLVKIIAMVLMIGGIIILSGA